MLAPHPFVPHNPVSMATAEKLLTQAPVRSLDQRMEALARANSVRVQRARLKRDLKDGVVDVVSIILDTPAYLHSAKVFDLLLAVPKLGRVKVSRLLTLSRVSQAKTVGGLSERQRAELIELLRARL